MFDTIQAHDGSVYIGSMKDRAELEGSRCMITDYMLYFSDFFYPLGPGRAAPYRALTVPTAPSLLYTPAAPTWPVCIALYLSMSFFHCCVSIPICCHICSWYVTGIPSMMLTLLYLVWIFILTSLIPMYYNEDNQCRLEVFGLEGIHQPGDILIGAVLPVRVADIFQQLSFTAAPPRTTCTR